MTTEASKAVGGDREAGARAATAILAGTLILAITNAVAIAVAVRWPSGGLALRMAHHLFDVAQTLGVGAVFAAVIGLWVAFVPLPLWANLLVYAGASTVIFYFAMGGDLLRQAVSVFGGRFERPLFALYLGLCGVGLPATHVIGAFFARFRRLRAVPLLLGLGGIAVNHAVLRDDYPGVHGAVAWGAVTIMGAAIAPAVLDALRARPWSRRRRALSAAALVAVALAGIVIPPPNQVRLELFREPGSTAAWVLAKTLWSAPAVSEGVSVPPSPWFADRSHLPAIPPTRPALFTRPPVVVFVTIDAVRADVIDDPENERVFPTIAELKRTSAYFANATSPGSQTAVSLTTVFSGKNFSQLVWGMHGQGSSRFLYAAADPTPRFPELLKARHVTTASFCSVNFLASEFGIIRGFVEERMLTEGRRHAFAKPMTDPLLARLRRLKANEPAFLYVHLMEPHAPYDRGAAHGSDRERYISEIGVADVELGRIARLMEQRFPENGVLIVSSDHGEAFGEHETWNHTKTLYEELLRVPLFIRGPGVRARRIESHVGVIDVGATVLDLFGVGTPASVLGQSLVPLLAGGDVQLERPLFAEGRLRRALYVGGLKVIEDLRRKTVEVYDLERDPLEERNLFPGDRARSEPALAALRAFFAAHSVRVPGYVVPFKP